jgi:hypothetical protein
MRRVLGVCALIASVAACSSGVGESITDVSAPFGGVYTLRRMNAAELPLYFSPAWYPGRASIPGLLSSTLLSADLIVRPDGTYTWITQLEEVATKPQTNLPEYIVFRIRREANGTWSFTESTGAVSLQGIDQFGAYILTGLASSRELTLSSTFAGRPNSTFVLER